MKALVKNQSTPGLWLQEVPHPHIGDDEVLVRIVKNAICGTDMHIYQWDDWARRTVPVPMIIGHEFTGVIEQVGRNVLGYAVGDRVCAEGHITCGSCRNCRTGRRHLCIHTEGIGYDCTGVFAEFAALPASNIFPVPDNISDDIAAIFDPLGNAVHTALSTDLIGEDVLITGVGPVGAMATAVAAHAGARNVVVTDLNERRLKLAQELGATATVQLGQGSLEKTMKRLGLDEGFSVGMEMSGHPSALETLLATAAGGAHISLLGFLPRGTGIDWDQVLFRGITLKGIYGREIFGTWDKMARMIQSGLNIEPVITHRYPIEEFQKGFQAMESGEATKVLLEWSV